MDHPNKPKLVRYEPRFDRACDEPYMAEMPSGFGAYLKYNDIKRLVESFDEKAIEQALDDHCKTNHEYREDNAGFVKGALYILNQLKGEMP